jgi:hypothetical protein
MAKIEIRYFIPFVLDLTSLWDVCSTFAMSL